MRVKQHLHWIMILCLLCCLSAFGTIRVVDAQEVHALLVILGNDTKIEDSVMKSEVKMVNMLKQLSYHCNVYLTIMRSEGTQEGIVDQKTFRNGRGEKRTKVEQDDIIHSRQVAEWLEKCAPNAEDTVLIYYNGHGTIDSFGTHELIFDPGLHMDTPDRGKFSQKLKQKPARLRMLITDTCSNISDDLSDDTYAKYAVEVRAKARPYLQHIFLAHKGFLDITAASPGQFAIGHADLGGHFTSALVSQGFGATADVNNDNFLTWDETFAETVKGTEDLYEKATFSHAMQSDLQSNRQKTQTPLANHLLPVRIHGSSTESSPDTPASVAILNFTSTPSGAKVYIDGFTVGKTPLKDYQLETDGQNAKEIEVTVELAGYEPMKEKFRVPRGKPFAWPFELTKKEPEIPKPSTGPNVHALLVLLGNDRGIRASVDVNQKKLVNMLKQLSHYCEVHLTTMHSNEFEATVSRNTFTNGRSKNATRETQDIIKSHQVTTWLANLTPAAEDTIFIYYNGHSRIAGSPNLPFLYFSRVSGDNINISNLSKALLQKSARLKILIADTYSNRPIKDLPGKSPAAIRMRLATDPSYIEDLFLEHKGSLGITAVSPDEFVIEHGYLDGFTSVLVEQGFTSAADRDGNTFLSWQEAFLAARTEMIERFGGNITVVATNLTKKIRY